MTRPSRLRIAAVALAVLLAAGALAGAGEARALPRPRIMATEAGYFGSAAVTWRISVFVYSDLGPAAGNRVTVCLGGVCRRARGHNARLAWYSASFRLRRGLRMGQRVAFTATASDASGSTRVHASDPLLCMHNNGSTPQH
ncbi:MAG TPA: hypothetical protein VKV27_06735 [Solirubrobacteraceae bacterium]|nr:hypothetical protein [Solirubrobacteraceae bacterium]